MADTLAAHSDRSPRLGIGWIKANFFGALANVAAAFGAYALGQAFAAPSLELGSVQLNIIFAATIMMVTLSYLLLAFLTAQVLAQKLPGFNKGRWLALYAVIGLAIGAATAFALYLPEQPSKGPEAWEFLTFAAIGTALLFGLAGAAFGGLQALALRHAAHGLKAWIGFTALSCMVWVIPVLAEIFGPHVGLAKELTFQAAALSSAVIASFIMLPALRRLAPR